MLWTEAEVQGVNLEGQFYAGDIRLTGLRAATVYVAKVASKNSYGYNDFGQEFKFATKGAGMIRFSTPCFIFAYLQCTIYLFYLPCQKFAYVVGSKLVNKLVFCLS